MIELPEKSLEVIYLDEPLLEFGRGQVTDYPKDGLYLFGPRTPKPLRKVINIGVVGTRSGLEYFKDWSADLLRRVAVPAPGKRDKQYRLHLSDFPGMRETFGIGFDPNSFVECEVSFSEINRLTSISNQHEAVTKSVDLYVDQVKRHHSEEEEPVDVWVFVLPEIIFERCKPQAKRSNVDLTEGDFSKKQSKRETLPLLAPVLDQRSEDIFDDVPDFHRQVKAKLLHLGHTSQLVRETTLAPHKFLNKAGYPKRGTQDPATVAWNLATGLFYKTQAEPPWKIANMRPSVCYVGLVFKKIPDHPQDHVCCAAQMFLSEGDGVVFRGANGPWETTKREFHLSKEAAKKLITTVLGTYKSKYGEYPAELFIHGTTHFSKDEWEAFKEVAPAETAIVGVRIRPTHGEIKLFRDGDYPCLRGTAILLDEQRAFLWTSGFLPRLDTYIGPETPNPIEITILKSTGDQPPLEVILRDILGLTKINYNACNFSDSQPVTIRFAQKVGDVLVTGSAKDADRQPFKFYI